MIVYASISYTCISMHVHAYARMHMYLYMTGEMNISSAVNPPPTHDNLPHQ